MSIEKTIKCPCCNEELSVFIDGDNILLSPLSPPSDDEEVRKLLSDINIEFG